MYQEPPERIAVYTDLNSPIMYNTSCGPVLRTGGSEHEERIYNFVETISDIDK